MANVRACVTTQGEILNITSPCTALPAWDQRRLEPRVDCHVFNNHH
jgi:hypothetical protein